MVIKAEATRHKTQSQEMVIYDILDDGVLVGVAEELTHAAHPVAVTVTYTPEGGGRTEFYAVPTNERAAEAAAMAAGADGMTLAADAVSRLFDRGFGVYMLVS